MSANAPLSAALLLFLIVTGGVHAGEEVSPKVTAVDSILGPPAATCPAVQAGGYHIGVLEGNDATLQRALNLVLHSRDDYVAMLFYASWCPFSKMCRPDFHKMSSLFPTIRHFAFEESVIKPSMLSRYGVRAFPTLFLLNSTMRVRYHGARTINSLVAFYKDVSGVNPSSMDKISQDNITVLTNIIEANKESEEENCPFSWARSPEKLLRQDICLALASSFVLLRLLHFLLPKLNACMKPAWRGRMDEFRRLFPRPY